jgi:hypothetical protein
MALGDFQRRVCRLLAERRKRAGEAYVAVGVALSVVLKTTRGFTPAGIWAHARRSSRYVQADLDAMSFDGPVPDAGSLSRHWHAALDDAESSIGMLPLTAVGEAVLDERCELFQGDAASVRAAFAEGKLRFHRGRLGGAWPTVRAE